MDCLFAALLQFLALVTRQPTGPCHRMLRLTLVPPPHPQPDIPLLAPLPLTLPPSLPSSLLPLPHLKLGFSGSTSARLAL
jgi:hypothetical protein